MPKRLLLLNGLAIASVVLFHGEGWAFTAMFAWMHRYLPPEVTAAQQAARFSYYGLRVVEQFVVFCIPAFLFVSGYFMAFTTGRNRSTIDWKVVWSRIKQLGTAYLFWTLILWLVLWLEGRRYSPAAYLQLLVTGATNPAYYFVPLLIQLYLLSPLIVWLARTRWKALLIVTGLLQIAVHLLAYPATLHMDMGILQPVIGLVPRWFFAARLFWYCLGVVFGFHVPEFKQVLERTRGWALASAGLLLVLGIAEWEWLRRLAGDPALQMTETLVDALYAGAFIWAFLGYSNVGLPFSEALAGLSRRSFGIYLIHSPVMEYVSRGLYHLAPGILAYPLILLPILVALGLGVPLLAMWAVSRSPARRLYAYSFG